MADFDDDLFRQEMTGVAPLKEDDRVRDFRRGEPTLTQRLRRASVNSLESDSAARAPTPPADLDAPLLPPQTTMVGSRGFRDALFRLAISVLARHHFLRFSITFQSHRLT